jgi:hypothetical protein
MSHIYALHDSDSKNFPMVRINLEQAHAYNSKGYGIFHTVQDFTGPRRIKNLARINAWAIDIDDRPKEEQYKRIKQGLIPTMVVESKRGFHVYWAARDASKNNWNAIVADRLVPYYQADPKARDLARILRRPGYYHLKNPSDPFLINKVWTWNVAYTEFEMAMFYPSNAQKKEALRKHDEIRWAFPSDGSFWERVWHLNCEDGLTHLSGHPYVGGEVYSFKVNANGTKNIWVNGKSTSCWIDREGRIGSLDGGGPTIYQWLNWFHKNPQYVVKMITEVFPHVAV